MGNSASQLEEEVIRRATMQELATAAKLFYKIQTKEEKEKIKDFFKKLDADGDGKVSIEELKKGGSNSIAMNDLFNWVDRDGSQYLDLKECTALFYVMSTKPICDMCSRFILQNGFKCIQCFRADQSFSICFACFNSPSHTHMHPQEDFMDLNMIHALLRRPEFLNKQACSTNEFFRTSGKSFGIALQCFLYLAEGTAFVVDMMGGFGLASAGVFLGSAYLSREHRKYRNH